MLALIASRQGERRRRRQAWQVFPATPRPLSGQTSAFNPFIVSSRQTTTNAKDLGGSGCVHAPLAVHAGFCWSFQRFAGVFGSDALHRSGRRPIGATFRNRNYRPLDRLHRYERPPHNRRASARGWFELGCSLADRFLRRRCSLCPLLLGIRPRLKRDGCVQAKG